MQGTWHIGDHADTTHVKFEAPGYYNVDAYSRSHFAAQTRRNLRRASFTIISIIF